ncbi:MAG: extracellular solute-binding protein [Clostridiales bacterium]|nr:extracellular solute-binding protein [Clostridiales bacterium]
MAKRIVACGLCFAMVLGLCGCKKNQKSEEVRTVKETDPFFDVTEYEMKIPVDETREIETIDIERDDVSFMGNMVSISDCRIEYAMSDEVSKQLQDSLESGDWETYQELLSQYSDEYRLVFDMEGNLVRKTVVNSGDFGNEESLITIFVNRKGEQMAVVSHPEGLFLEKVMDNGDLEQVMPLDSVMAWNVIELPDGRLVCSGWDSISILGADGKLQNSVSTEECHGDLYYVDGKIYGLCSDISHEDFGEFYTYYQEFDPDTLSFVGEKYKNLHGASLVEAGNGLYYTNINGIVKADIMDASNDKEVFSWSDTDYDFKGENPLGTKIKVVSENEYYFLSTYDTEMDEFDKYICSVKLVHVVKAEKNPYAGKKLLTIGMCGQILDMDDVIRYNTDPKAKCRITVHEYSEDMHMDGDTMNINAAMSDKVYLDVISGNGPDILVGFSVFSQFSSDKVMVDLNPLIDGTDGKGLDRNKYFDNILRAQEEDGKLYFMPVTFQINYMAANPSLVGQDCDWTYDEFFRIMDALPEEVSVYPETRYDELLSRLVSETEDRFIDYTKKEVNFDSEAFQQLLTFVKKYGKSDEQMRAYSNDGYVPTPDRFDNDILALYPNLALFNVRSYANAKAHVGEDAVFCGFPSSKGGSPAASMSLTIGISKYSPNQEEAWDFIRFMLETQENKNWDGRSGLLTISRDALDRESEAFVKRYDEQIKLWRPDPLSPDNRPIETKPEMGAELVKQVERVRTVASSDPTVMLIILEEAPAYFTGQRSLDDVVKIIQNRCTTIVNERG